MSLLAAVDTAMAGGFVRDYFTGSQYGGGVFARLKASRIDKADHAELLWRETGCVTPKREAIFTASFERAAQLVTVRMEVGCQDSLVLLANASWALPGPSR